jgi:hypothetical protein
MVEDLTSVWAKLGNSRIIGFITPPEAKVGAVATTDQSNLNSQKDLLCRVVRGKTGHFLEFLAFD